MPEFYMIPMIFAREIFFPIFCGGRGECPPLPPPLPVSYAYDRDFSFYYQNCNIVCMMRAIQRISISEYTAFELKTSKITVRCGAFCGLEASVLRP